MPKIWKHFTRKKTEDYQFPDASELILPEMTADPVVRKAPRELPPEPEVETEEAEETEEELESVSGGGEPLQYAQFQANSILQEAHRQAADLLEQARQDAVEESKRIFAQAEEDGRREGYMNGLDQAMEEARRKLQAETEAQGAMVQQFLDKAAAALDRQMDDNVDELRDLALAVAEKVVSVSLKSSSEVIGRMIQAAIDKRKRKEWVHIYIAERDAKHMGHIPESLAASLAALSDRVRIIPMADDESGTCIIEMPDEIVDASAATQLNNLRSMLTNTPAGGAG